MSGGIHHPPVLLVPGWSDTSRKLEHARRFLVGSGWPAGYVSCVDFADRYGSNVEHAAELADAADRLLRRTGELELAIVAHSMGGLATRWYLSSRPEPPVHTAIFVGTPHRGTWLAWIARGRGGAEMRPGSAFLQALRERPLPRALRAICIRTRFETRVVPGSSALLAGTECHTLRLPSHPRLLRHAGTLHLIRSLLQDSPPANAAA